MEKTQTQTFSVRKPVAAVWWWWWSVHVFWGMCTRKRAQAGGGDDDDDDDEKNKTDRSFVPDVDVDAPAAAAAGGRANAFNEHQERVRVAVPPVQGRRWDTALNNLTGLLLRARSRDHQPASVCVREPYLTESRTFRLLVGTAKSRQEFCTFPSFCMSVAMCQLPPSEMLTGRSRDR